MKIFSSVNGIIDESDNTSKVKIAVYKKVESFEKLKDLIKLYSSI